MIFRKMNKKAFSLVELMIVVAIIGLLAAIGVPQYAKFQARARQSEAKAALGALYSAEQSFFQEWNCFSTDLRNIGFGVTGTNLRYITGFTNVSINGAVCNAGTPAPNGANFGMSDGNANAAALAAISPGAVWAGTAAVLGFGRGQVAATAAPAAAALSTTFIGASAGDPKNTQNAAANADNDTWTINQLKTLANSNPRL